MSRFVAVLPLEPGARARAEALLREGPPFDLEETQFDRHLVFVTDREVVFVFEGRGPATPSSCRPRTRRSGRLLQTGKPA